MIADADSVLIEGTASMLMAVREFGYTDGGSIWPILTSSGNIVLEPDEKVLWSFSSEIRCSQFISSGNWGTVWQMPKQAAILVTDRRFAYVCEKYDVGKRTVITGVSVTADLARVAAAKLRRRGTAAAGQIRYEWLNSVYCTPSPNSICVRAIDSDGVYRQVALGHLKGSGAPKDVRQELGPQLVRTAALWRLAHQGDFPLADSLERFRAFADNPRAAIQTESSSATRYFLGASVTVGGTAIAVT